MIYRGKAILSTKLAKQLKALERKPEHITFGQLLDVVTDRVNVPLTPKERRRRG
jgi:hypothetical protein